MIDFYPIVYIIGEIEVPAAVHRQGHDPVHVLGVLAQILHQEPLDLAHRDLAEMENGGGQRRVGPALGEGLVDLQADELEARDRAEAPVRPGPVPALAQLRRLRGRDRRGPGRARIR